MMILQREEIPLLELLDDEGWMEVKPKALRGMGRMRKGLGRCSQEGI